MKTLALLLLCCYPFSISFSQNLLLSDNLENHINQQKNKITNILGNQEILAPTLLIKNSAVAFSNGSYMYYMNEDDILVRISTISGEDVLTEIFNNGFWIAMTGADIDEDVNYKIIVEHLFYNRKEEEIENLEIIQALVPNQDWDGYRFDENRRDFLFFKTKNIDDPYCIYRVEYDFFKRDDNNTYVANLDENKWIILPLYPGNKLRSTMKRDELIAYEKLIQKANKKMKSLMSISDSAFLDSSSILYHFKNSCKANAIELNQVVLKPVTCFRFLTSSQKETGKLLFEREQAFYFRTDVKPRMFKTKIIEGDIQFEPLELVQQKDKESIWLDKKNSITIITSEGSVLKIL